MADYRKEYSIPANPTNNRETEFAHMYQFFFIFP